MAEITCPNCHKTFTISEEEYKSIRAQLRDQEFVAALHEREQVFEQSKLDAVKLAEAAVTQDLQQVISEKAAEISSLKAQLATKTTESELAVKNAVADKEKQIAELAAKIEAAVEAKSAAVNEVVAQKDTEISRLQGQISNKESEYKLKLQEEVAQKEAEIARLNAQIEANKTEQELAVQKAVSEKTGELTQKDLEIEKLKGQLDNKEKEAELAQKNLKASYEQQLELKDEQIGQLKDFKAKQSTKMVGESLEVFCKNEFDRIRAIGFQNATFEKDNKVSETGSKGDFIFRETEDDVEFISIMFEMKNEMDTTATKHKNEDFFKELDKDRREKKCEYAVLVTLLEPENDLYNNGIVDVSHKYEKMYVVRPQFFIPIITLLRNAARNSLKYQKELVTVRNQNIDITNFEAKLNEFKDKFDRDCRLADKNFEDAISDIDKTIKNLEKIKKELQLTVSHLKLADNKLQDITIKKLVKGNPTMAAKFEELKTKPQGEE
ncbi:DUF2130 domain-containing protein [Succiniclasticum ruminis]|uniref:DUF2130 domain-containing protein n=1 Tax=Succiniclasticum ruminis DSM 9236 TaxID=1123323 RepID=A0A1I2EDJ1_9FIRM|nr:DUF2130 domain-containing protein [Succiniclasticum ruminis]SFE91012.1 hypothetical protein SAMN05216245_1357 [Succiniclasticum ruminis DSM 9236]